MLWERRGHSTHHPDRKGPHTGIGAWHNHGCCRTHRGDSMPWSGAKSCYGGRSVTETAGRRGRRGAPAGRDAGRGNWGVLDTYEACEPAFRGTPVYDFLIEGPTSRSADHAGTGLGVRSADAKSTTDEKGIFGRMGKPMWLFF